MKILQHGLLMAVLAMGSTLLASQHVMANPIGDTDSASIIQVYSGEPVRLERRISNKLPSIARSTLAWRQFETRHRDGSWKVMWDQDTGIPLRIYGSGLSAADSVESADAAATHASHVLAQEIELLAPGSQIQDFTLVSNTVHNGVRVVGFQQSVDGIKVLGGQLSFRFKHDRLIAMASEAYPFVAVTSNLAASLPLVESKALDWVQSEVDSNSRQISAASAPLILPLVRTGNSINIPEYVVVRSVMVKSDKPIGRWEVYVNASTGEPVTRHQRLMFGPGSSGTALYNTPMRWPGGTYADYPAAHANLVVNKINDTTDTQGQFSWSGSTASVDTLMAGPFVSVSNEAGSAATANFNISDAGSFTWSEPTNEFVDAQITTFVHANRIKDYVRPWNPGLAWLDLTIPVTVNINDTCNAFSDGNSINFFKEGGGCNNTGRLVDVIYHEFGHSFHQQSIIQGVGAYEPGMGEGVGDFLSATVVNDSSLAPGFSLNGNSLREIDPVGSEAVYPDDLSGSVHSNGLIYSGAFWDLRKALIIELGEAAGIEATERLFYATLQRAVDMTSSYVEALVEDDDDGDLANGTPNYCLIEEAFAIHGLTGNIEHPQFGALTINGLDVTVPSSNGFACTTVTSMSLEWQSRSDPGQNGSIPMTQDVNTYNATIPFNSMGEVVQYRVVANFSNASTKTQPTNMADPWYEKFIGATNIISCTDFETDPALDGWTHALISGTAQAGADDWQWGIPMGTGANNDPTTAFSGTRIYGNDLGGGNFNGLYQSDIVNETVSPTFDVSGYDFVRLHYQRWLNVEDGTFDQASIYANGVLVWSNFASVVGGSGTVQHQDSEWSFRDVDLTAAVVNNAVQLRFEMASDGGLEFGGWSLDDVCLVGYNGEPLPDVIFLSGFETD